MCALESIGGYRDRGIDIYGGESGEGVNFGSASAREKGKNKKVCEKCSITSHLPAASVRALRYYVTYDAVSDSAAVFCQPTPNPLPKKTDAKLMRRNSKRKVGRPRRRVKVTISRTPAPDPSVSCSSYYSNCAPKTTMTITRTRCSFCSAVYPPLRQLLNPALQRRRRRVA